MSDPTIRERLRELAEKATPGPWVRLTHGTASQRDAAMRAALAVMAVRAPDNSDIEYTDLTWIEQADSEAAHIGLTGNGPTSIENAELIVEMRNALPALLTELDTLERRAIAATDALRDLIEEYDGSGDGFHHAIQRARAISEGADTDG